MNRATDWVYECTDPYHDTVTFQRPALRSELLSSWEFPSERWFRESWCTACSSLLPLSSHPQLHPTYRGLMHRNPQPTKQVYLHFFNSCHLAVSVAIQVDSPTPKRMERLSWQSTLLRLHLSNKWVQVWILGPGAKIPYLMATKT